MEDVALIFCCKNGEMALILRRIKTLYLFWRAQKIQEALKRE